MKCDYFLASFGCTLYKRHSAVKQFEIARFCYVIVSLLTVSIPDQLRYIKEFVFHFTHKFHKA
jgi:hypothetical protein